MSNRTVSPVFAAIILIAVTVAVSIAVAAFLGSITFSFMRELEAVSDIYDPRNSTLNEAYGNCIKELEQLNYTVLDAEFQKEVWIETETFVDFVGLLEKYNVTIVFVDSPKGRGWLFWNRVGPFTAYIWFNHDLPSGESVTIYYELKRR